MSKLHEKGLIFLIIIVFGQGGLYCQNYVNSPYSRFGIGDLKQEGFAHNRALGRVSIPLRSSNQINYLNPASYSAQDTLSFIFDVGLQGQINNLITSAGNASTRNYNIDHLAIGFPVTKWWKSSIGIVPYSRIGYNLIQEGTLAGSSDDVSLIYKGEGGINEFYIGSSFELFNHISIGLNAGYLFGSLNQSRSAGIESTYSAVTWFEDKLVAGDFFFQGGIQVYGDLWKKHHLTLGLAVDNETSLSSRNDASILRITQYTEDTLSFEQNRDGILKIPLKLGLGLAYTYNDQLLIAADYISQDWTKGLVFGSNDRLNPYHSFHFGIEYKQVSVSQRARANYWQLINYRIGGHYSNSYIKTDDNEISDIGISFGLGLPWKNTNNMLTKTSFNITYELGQRGSENINALKETYHIFSVGITIYDFWFIQSKYD